jgi:LytS/YehU family sensor histidine kinase
VNKLIAEYQLTALQAQMNPHFIFNAINSIQGYILKKNEQQAYDYLAKFSKLIRMVLNQSTERTLPLKQELEMLSLYVELEQLRFDQSFDFKLDVDKDLRRFFGLQIPSMLVQPYVENAIWHGLMNLNKDRKGMLSVEFKLKDEILKITIEDNGVGRELSKTYKKETDHKSVGMILTEQRLMMINKLQEYEDAWVTITDLYDEKKKPSGTQVEIFIPVLS